MRIICFTDHNDFDWPPDNTSFLLDCPSYISRIADLREEYAGKIDIRCGIECGLQTQIIKKNRELIGSAPFDFVIGSIHVVNDFDPFYPEYFAGRTDREAFMEYFQTVLENIKAFDDFDVLGHMDYIVRYSPNKDKNFSLSAYSDIIDEILKTLIEKGKGIEVNTGGLAAGLSDPNPRMEIVKRYRQLGGSIITVGSDAHTPGDVGRYFDAMPRFLSSCGFDHYTVFKNRKPEFISL